MKELSIEKKAKRYDKAIERAEGLIDFCSDSELKTLKYVFPELKESEDERIMKDIVEAVELHKDFTQGRKEHIYAWLEKQGKLVEYYEDKLDRCACNNFNKGYKAAFEKQGEQKPIDKIQLGKKYKCIATPRYSTFVKGLIYRPSDEFLCSLMNFCSDCFEPMEDNEQNPADKVEPKFKVGDWVVNNEYNNTAKVLEVNEQYRLDYCDTIGTVSVELIDNDYHLWTIQDAKDGDVLSYVTDEEDLWIMIYWSLYEPYEGHVHYHALLVNDNFGDKGTCCICIDNLKPATKEQRDTLFAKMKEAGYEWSDKDRKLIKIAK